MELRVEEVQVPSKIGFNYEELKQQLTARCEDYRTMIYTPETIKEAKADRAMLNRLKDSLNAERIRRQKEYMRPFETFKNQIDDLIDIIGEASAAIDTQVKSFEEDQKRKKKEDIETIFSETDFPDFVTISQIYNPKWINKTYTLKAIRADMEDSLKRIQIDIANINSTFTGETSDISLGKRAAMDEYQKSLDLSMAIPAGNRAAHLYREQEKEKAAVKTAPAVQEEKKEEKPAVREEVKPVQEQPTKKRAQRVVVEIIAEENQFDALNALFIGINKSGAVYRIIEKEEV